MTPSRTTVNWSDYFCQNTSTPLKNQSDSSRKSADLSLSVLANQGECFEDNLYDNDLSLLSLSEKDYLDSLSSIELSILNEHDEMTKM